MVANKSVRLRAGRWRISRASRTATAPVLRNSGLSARSAVTVIGSSVRVIVESVSWAWAKGAIRPTSSSKAQQIGRVMGKKKWGDGFAASIRSPEHWMIGYIGVRTFPQPD
jgi:hypothetical protein